MKIVLASDTHGLHDKVEFPDGDMIIFAGDISNNGQLAQIENFNTFLGTLSYKYKIVIAGNHDFFFEKNHNKVDKVLNNAIYLYDSMIQIEGINIYGSPWQPWFCDWAFNVKSDVDRFKIWQKIPYSTDILITHCPPFGIGDRTNTGELVGCKELAKRLDGLNLKLHVFGHIHESYGVCSTNRHISVNASACNELYNPINSPIVIETHPEWGICL